ncbi:stage III sporulation protein AF [Lachnospiraceae bacterium MD308]|jgi:Stage III sporulation protein AF (Spore_III_AF).|nr:stage III sporulation protein AF [Lachnospiraceae bacterium MD308]
MFQYLYEWTQNLAFYIVLITAVLHAVPDSGYKKYIRFFTGMVLILMMVTPIFRIFGKDSQIMNFYKSREYETKLREIENASDYFKDFDSADILKEAEESTGEQDINDIRVEEIQIEGEKETDRHTESEKD